ncbi:hypothetical protein ACE102_03080 [Bradyrhizobium sp. vgs-9]|uniref:hypothetical protein n=1 Tax=Bradyrhizobium sp. vgs-9 TaxID=208389 RepID=UPI0035D41CF2
MSFSDAEIAGLIKRGFIIENGMMASITSGEITVAVLSGRDLGGLFQLIIKVPNGIEIFCKASPIEIMGEWGPAKAVQ